MKMMDERIECDFCSADVTNYPDNLPAHVFVKSTGDFERKDICCRCHSIKLFTCGHCERMVENRYSVFLIHEEVFVCPSCAEEMVITLQERLNQIEEEENEPEE